MTGRFARPRATIHAVTQPLTARERDILALLLSIDLPGAGGLREQAMSVSAEREGMVIDLIVNEGLPSATVVSRTPVQLPSMATAPTVAYSSCGRRSAVGPRSFAPRRSLDDHRPRHRDESVGRKQRSSPSIWRLTSSEVQLTALAHG
jgi:hypothetical protein